MEGNFSIAPPQNVSLFCFLNDENFAFKEYQLVPADPKRIRHYPKGNLHADFRFREKSRIVRRRCVPTLEERIWRTSPSWQDFVNPGRDCEHPQNVARLRQGYTEAPRFLQYSLRGKAYSEPQCLQMVGASCCWATLQVQSLALPWLYKPRILLS